MANKNVIYVPDKYVDDIKVVCIQLAGGDTPSPGHKGYWENPVTGEVIEDDITLVTVFETGYDALSTCRELLFRWGEDAVAYEINGYPHLDDGSKR